MKKLLIKIINYLEDSPADFNKWIISFVGIITIRFYIGGLVLKFPKGDFLGLLINYIHDFIFFTVIFFVLYWFLKKITQEDNKKIINFLIWGAWLIILPPLFDKIIFKNQTILTYYIFDGLSGLSERFVLFFGNNPTVGITLGNKITTFLVCFSLASYVWIKKIKIKYFFMSFFLVYAIFFFFSSLPSWITLTEGVFLKINIFKINHIDIAQNFLTPLEYFNFNFNPGVFLVYRMSLFLSCCLFVFFCIFLFFNHKEKFIALVKNIRYPQTIFNSGLLIIGLGLGWFYFPKEGFDIFSGLIIVNLLIMVFSAWFYSVFINDLTDQKIDIYTNQNRPLVKKIFNEKEYLNLSKIFLFFSLEISLLMGFQIFGMVVIYHFLTWIYSCYPFRFKKYYPISALLSSFASLIFLLIGFMIFSPHQTLENFPWRIFVFLFVAFFLILPAKDFKDIEGDKKDNVYTLPVIFGEKIARKIMAGSLFFLYLLSVIILREQRLFLGALFFGSVSFWLMFYKKISRRHIVWYLLGLVFLYWLLVTKIIFA